jgi:hypothetical protein
MSFTAFISFVNNGMEFFMATAKMLAIEGLFFYGKVCVVVQNKTRTLFLEYPLMKQAVEIISYYVQYVKNVYCGIKIEPYSKTWVNLSVLYWDQDIGYDTHEGYSYNNPIFDKLTQNFLLSNNAESKINFIQSVNKNIFTNSYNNLVCFTDIYKSSVVKEIMVIMKWLNKYIVEIKTANNEEYVGTQFPVVSSRVKFLSILYTHPNMKNPIEIDLGDKYNIMHNKILSPLFLKRYLEYSYDENQYIFDMNYRLKIIDSNIKSYELISDNYIILYKDTFEVRLFSKDANECEEKTK